MPAANRSPSRWSPQAMDCSKDHDRRLANFYPDTSRLTGNHRGSADLSCLMSGSSNDPTRLRISTNWGL
jgi:hypothetical protein